MCVGVVHGQCAAPRQLAKERNIAGCLFAKGSFKFDPKVDVLPSNKAQTLANLTEIYDIAHKAEKDAMVISQAPVDSLLGRLEDRAATREP